MQTGPPRVKYLGTDQQHLLVTIQVNRLILTLLGKGSQEDHPANFFPVISMSVGITAQNFVTVSSNPFLYVDVKF